MKNIHKVILFMLIMFSTMSVSFATTHLGETSYGYVDKVVYGNESSDQTIVLIIGVHPQENGIHTAIATTISSKSASLNKRYVLYYVHITKDVNDYSKSRMNGQLLAQQFVVPDVSSEKPMLVIDNHENHGASSGYAYYRFLYPISNTEITKIYANQIINAMSFLRIYYPPNPTSTKYVTVPIANKGIPTIIYETYLYDSVAKKASDASALIDALDNKVIHIPTITASPVGGYFNSPRIVTLTADKEGSIYYTTNGSIPSIDSTPYTDPIKINNTTTLKYIAIDTEGRQSGVYTQTYIIDKVPPKVLSTYPKNGATGVSRTVTISIKFSENIKSNINWSKIAIKNKYGKVVSTSKWISGNTLYIKTTYKRTRYSYYSIYIPSGAIKDYAGNNMGAYGFKFKTGRY